MSTPDFTDKYNTPLPPGSTAAYQEWLGSLPPDMDKSGRDYDLQGAFAAHLSAADNGHLPDTFKKPNHLTFSNESQYSGKDGYQGGQWSKQGSNWQFAASATNLQMHSQDELTKYFSTTEKGNSLVVPQSSPWQDAVNKARAAGYSWDEIGQYQNTMRQKAADAGYSGQEIDGFFGFKDQDKADERMAAAAKANAGAGPLKPIADAWEGFKAGVERSSGGLIIHGQPTTQLDPETAGHVGRLAAQIGEASGDVPAMIIGGLAGATVGGGTGAAAGAAAGAAVPVAGETGASEAAGAVAGGGYGVIAAGGAGAMALPQAIKSEYADGLANGQYKGPWDFLTRQGKVLWDTSKAAAMGAVLGPLAKGARFGASALGGGKVAQGAADYLSQVAGLTTMNATIQHKLPTLEETVDAGIVVGAFKGAGVTSEKLIGPIKKNLIQNWAMTDQRPKAAAAEAATNPFLRQNIVAPAPPEPRPASSETGDFVVGRAAGSFDSAVDWVMKEEGGLTKDTGGVTKYGISQNAHPDIDIKDLTPQQAQEVYHSEYWNKIGAEKLPENMRLPAFDAAVNEGVGKAKEMLKEAGGDVQKFLQLRAQHYSDLIAANEDKYGKYAGGWFNRLRALGFDGKRPAPSSEGGEAGGGAKGPGSVVAAEEPPGSEDPWKIVGSHIAGPDEGTPLIDRFKDEAYKAYTDLFDPLDPIHKLTQAVNDGQGLADAANPEFLQRIAEHHVELAQYAVKENMVDLEGNVAGPGLEKIISPFVEGKDLDRFWAYSAARWGLEKAGQEKETGLDQSAITQVAAEGKERYGAAFDQLVDWQNSSLKWLKDSGIISEEQLDQWTTENKARIPGYRVMEEPQKFKGAGKKTFNPVKEFKGSEAQIKNVYQSLMRDAFLRMDLAQHNRANMATADLAERLGLAEKEPGQTVPVSISADELARNGIDSEGLDATVFRMARQQLTNDQVPVFREGKLERWTFDDPYIARYLRGFDQQTRTLFERMALPFTRFFRAGVVLNPLFPVRLMGYDVPWQFITKPGFRNTFADVITGLRNITTKSDEYDAWLRSGGAERIFDGLGRDQFIKDTLADKADPTFGSNAWGLVKTPYHALRAWGQLLNQAQRVGRYVRSGPEDFNSPIRQAIASSEAAFHRSTFGGPLARKINSVMPFTTAYLNSLDKMARAFTGHTLSGEKVAGADEIARTVIKATAVVTLPMLLNWAKDKDKEWYKAAPTWQKDNGLLINVGDDDGPGAKVIFYKFPPVVSFLFGGLPRRLAEGFLEDNPHAADGVSEGLAASLLPPGGLITYNVALPLIEHIANYSFFRGHPLVDEDTKRNMLPQYQANAYSTGTAKFLSKVVNDTPILRDMDLSPPVIDNYINEWTGSLGTAAAKMVGVATDKNQPAMTWSDMPLVSSWLARYPSSSAQPIIDFEDRGDKLDQIHGSIAAAFKQHDLAGFKKLAQENPVAAYLHRYNLKGAMPPDDVQEYEQALRGTSAHVDMPSLTQYVRATKAIQQMRQFAVKVRQADNKQISAEEKRQLLDNTYSWMQVTSERANNLLDQMGGK